MKKHMLYFCTAVLGASVMFSPAGFSNGDFSLLCRAEASEVTLGEVVTEMPSGDMQEYTPPKPLELLSGNEAAKLDKEMQAYNASGQTLLQNKAVSYYYYDHLEGMPKEIYDVMYQVAQDPVSEGNIGLIMTDIDPQEDEFYKDFCIAYRAICFDHPELFWLYSQQKANMVYLSEAVNQGGFYFVYIKMDEPYTDYEADMTAFNQAVEDFLADIDTGISEYETIRQIHDKLIDLVNYNDPVANAITLNINGQDLAHTAYGSLVADSSGNPNYAVCDGYSLAMEYLLQQCGIEAAFIGGIAGSSEEDAGGHAWNVVKMDDQWYELDSTWDDAGSTIDDLTPGTSDDYYLEALNDTEYRDKLDHFLFLVSTEEITHFVPGDEYDYITQDQQYKLSLVYDCVHIRMNNTDSGSDTDSSIIALAPNALQSYR